MSMIVDQRFEEFLGFICVHLRLSAA